MYLQSIEIENIGPIDHIQINFPKKGDHPKPIVIVGENGSGKSILLSHLVNSLIAGKQEVFDDVEIEKGKVFKYRSPSYIKSGKHYSFSSVNFDSEIKVQEWQLLLTRAEFEEKLNYTPIRREWQQIQSGEYSQFTTTFRNYQTATNDFFKKQCTLYFPVNRFEEPAWLNIDNLTYKASYTNLKHVSGYSNRDIICLSPLKENLNWLLDIIFDLQANEINISQPIPVEFISGHPVLVKLFNGYVGQSTNIYNALVQVLKVVLRETGDIRLNAGTRKNRKISAIKDQKSWIPNLFQLSTGETQLLNLFLSIVRDYDLSDGDLNDISDVKGIVIIDEIDSHLHTVHQREVLPELIALFPKVQFIITTHSPLFLLGMEDKFGGNGFDIIDMPHGEKVFATDFSEFTAAYDAFKETKKHREEIKNELESHLKPIVFVEGDYDIRYLRKAGELLGKEQVLESIQIKDANGFGGLSKIWKNYDNSVSEVLPSKILLLYDCDIKQQNNRKNLVYKRVIPSINTNSINIGIENLFPTSTIEKIEASKPQFIDLKEESTRRVRGEEIITPASKSVNKDEKGNMCNWLCEHGNADDFANFELVFRIIEEVINS